MNDRETREGEREEKGDREMIEISASPAYRNPGTSESVAHVLV